MSTIAEALDAIRSDIDQIEDMARWAFIDGWTPTRPNPDAPAPSRSIEPTSSSDPDHVDAPRLDIGLGVHASRTAYTAASHDLGLAHRWLIVAAHTAGARSVPAIEPWSQRQIPSLGELLTAAAAMRRLVLLVRTGTPDDLTRPSLSKARSFTDSSWHHLSALFLKGAADPDQHAVGEDPCRICGIRPQAPKAGKRCKTCKTWFDRNGYERPTSLDPVHSGREAQARRRARGEGHGDESFSGARGA